MTRSNNTSTIKQSTIQHLFHSNTHSILQSHLSFSDNAVTFVDTADNLVTIAHADAEFHEGVFHGVVGLEHIDEMLTRALLLDDGDIGNHNVMVSAEVGRHAGEHTRTQALVGILADDLDGEGVGGGADSGVEQVHLSFEDFL